MAGLFERGPKKVSSKALRFPVWLNSSLPSQPVTWLIKIGSIPPEEEEGALVVAPNQQGSEF